jgi:superfamily II DNA or RNA helicase
MRKEHPGTIPEDWSDLRYAYFVHTGKSRGRCRECGGETPWNETTGAYSKMCGSKECADKFRNRFMAAMRARYGKANLLEDPKYRERMLTGRRISGEYTFQDGGKVQFMGALEKAFLVMLDQFFRFPSADIMSPSPNRYEYYYTNENDKEHEGIHSYVPDFWIPSCNLEVELKASNNQRAANLMIDVVKDACKDIAMIRNPAVNFCKIYEQDYYVFFQIFSDIAEQHQTGEKRPIKYISRSLLTSLYRDYIPDDCLKILDQYIYKYSEKSVVKRKPVKATESAEDLKDPELFPILQEIIERDNIKEEADGTFRIEDVYDDPDPAPSDDNSDDEDDQESEIVGVNPMLFYKLGPYAEPATTASAEECFSIFNLDNEKLPAMEGFFDFSDNIDTDKIDGRAALQYGKWRDRLFNTKIFGDKVAKTFTKVTVENGNIVIKGINCNLLLYRIKEKYSEAKLKYIFEYKYNDRSYKLYQKKRIGKGDMKIDYVYAPVFFCLELVDLFNELGDHYHDASYKRIAGLIYDASWLSKADAVTVPELDTTPLKNLRIELMEHQVKFIKAWPQLKNQLNTNGYVLAFKPGKGKTLTAIGLAECLSARKVYIVCPNNLKDNWALEIKKYYAKYDNEATWMRDVCILGTKYGNPDTARFIITNNENIKLMLPIVSKDSDSVFILDECHNFRNFNGGRSKELFDLCDKIGSRNVLCVSATPIKAAPAEITPVLRIIDPTFTDEAANMYAHCFDLSNTMAMSLVSKRFGMVIYRPADVNVDLPPKHSDTLEYAISNEDRYYLDVVHQEIVDDFKQRHAQWMKSSQPAIQGFSNLIHQYALCDKRMCNGYISWVTTSADSLRGGDNNDFHEVAIQEYKEFIDTYIRPNSNCPATTADSLLKLQNEFITAAKRDMGKAAGSILPKRRTEMFIKLYEENKQDIYERIRNRGKKTIIFSTMVPVVKYISKDLNDFGIGAVTISGDTKNRLETLTRFREDPNVLVLVATSWCMGVGVTLTEASQMFFFGTPWRSTDFEQASDRIHRIGQTDAVDIWTVKMKSKKANLSDRMQKILEWSGKMFDTAITAAEFGEDAEAAPATESVAVDELYHTILEMNKRLNDYGYGIVKEGKYTVNPTDEEVSKYYTSISPGKFGKYKGGICFDYMAFEDLYLRSHAILPEPFVLRLPEINTSHGFVIVEDGDRYIYPESFMKKVAGVYTAKSLDEIVSFIVNQLRGNKPVTKIELIRAQSYYGRYDENAYDFFTRIYKQGSLTKIKFDPNVRTLNQIYTEEDALESFNMNVDSHQYELIEDVREMDELNHIYQLSIQLACARCDRHGADTRDWDRAAYIMQAARQYEPFTVMLCLNGDTYVNGCHPMVFIPFRDGALYPEFGLQYECNNLYYVLDINDAVSACTYWMLKDVNTTDQDLMRAKRNVEVGAFMVPNSMMNPDFIKQMKVDDIVRRVLEEGKIIHTEYHSATQELHEVEVLNYGWSIHR